MIYIIISEQNKYYNLIKNEQNEEKVFIHFQVYHEQNFVEKNRYNQKTKII